MAISDKTTNDKYWGGCAKAGALMYCWWEYHCWSLGCSVGNRRRVLLSVFTLPGAAGPVQTLAKGMGFELVSSGLEMEEATGCPGPSQWLRHGAQDRSEALGPASLHRSNISRAGMGVGVKVVTGDEVREEAGS